MSHSVQELPSKPRSCDLGVGPHHVPNGFVNGAEEVAGLEVYVGT
jgi:hypothetical protein